ncbi:NrsF family protein [Devosia sp.]|uniref:NrsF family protein n=1 Tax=Devosia sp. TaxID=1871048 RepID=UPI003A91573F
MSDALLDSLTADLRPVRQGAMTRRIVTWLVPAMALSAIIMVLWLDWRWDFPYALTDPIFWLKFGYTSIFTILALWATQRLGRPGGSMRKPLIGIGVLIGALALTAIVQLAMAEPDRVRPLVMGYTAIVCPLYILSLSVPILGATMLLMRRLAPTNLPQAGLAAGLLAGAASAWVYAFHCGETGLAFTTIFYTAGISAVALVGWLTGPFLLRWR